MGDPSKTRDLGEHVNEYRPERWLVDEKRGEESEKARIKEMNGGMFQFGAGSTTCIGKIISLLEIYKLVPSVLRGFEVSQRFHTESLQEYM